MSDTKAKINRFDRLMAAISFAEADEREMAMEVLGRDGETRKRKRSRRRIDRRKNERPDIRA
jgi:hypothetical protein